jgi:hypothetical protein
MFRRLNSHLQGDVSTKKYIIHNANTSISFAQHQNVKIMKRTKQQQ